VIQEFSPDGSDGPLANSILARASEGSLFDLQIEKILCFLFEVFAKFFVVVTYQIFVAALARKGVAELLDNPFSCRRKSY